MITVLLGQRGVGKTSLLRRLSHYFIERRHPVEFRDLDTEIERREQTVIADIFALQGEAHFRRLEKKHFHELLTELEGQCAFISLGAGFDTTLIPSTVRVIWLQRPSDKSGRIFLDRPSLEPGLSSLKEFFDRADKRKLAFRQAAWEEYLMPEGLREPSPIERKIEEQILAGEPGGVHGILTLLPENFISPERWQFFISRRLKWGFDYFEVRDDLLNEHHIEQVLKDIPHHKILWARRTEKAPSAFLKADFGMIDFDRTLAAQSHHVERPGRILSVHSLTLGESLTELLQDLETFEISGYHIKLALEIESFTEVLQGHEWALQKPLQRSFLPRSRDGRWTWYRRWKAPTQKINFIREGQGSAPDQPSLFEWLSDRQLLSQNQQRTNPTFMNFVALLGDPVQHSFTPIHQGKFFAEINCPVWPITVSTSEFDLAIPFLKTLGLIAAAVTSPIKIKAYELSQRRSAAAQRFQSVNTLVRLDDGTWSGHNTDLEGLVALFERAQSMAAIEDETRIAIWGGGGTLPLLKALKPKSESFSIQTGEHRDGKHLVKWNPEWVVWAGGRYHSEGTVTPPEVWKPKLVVDLNYREDSGGRELAKRTGAKYLSGEVMFFTQAEYQRHFWRPSLETLWCHRNI